MDGNRRFAKNRGLEVRHGHAEGADALEQTLDWCLKLGVKTVTVYAFSTENFSRDKVSEVDPIMSLSTEKFQKFASNSDIVKKHGIAVRVYGRLDLLPPPVKHAASLAAKMTATNSNAILNICMPYTSREEILYAVRTIVRGVEDGILDSDDISQEVLEKCFWTGGNSDSISGSGDVDILLRTSGEVRLSDFMLWQASNACQIKFLNVYWPDFTFWHMLPSLIQYQMSYSQVSQARNQHQKHLNYLFSSRNNDKNFCCTGAGYEEGLVVDAQVKRVMRFLDAVRKERDADAIKYCP
ncbi:hypothetical protein HK100_011098 [Physocladia obscura]|uniref:Alkyl transferase n=1 Tax=Physocladia obscura TaxID=109957 RepID=A0AAD5XED4_9FUNG|nr:hypothetical protein HK100_011098 [Physocladia obscura]